MPVTKTSPTYNLGAITHETGLNADTLRAWERRYNLPQPARSEGGQRLYSPRDLEILKWLIARQKEGLRISQAAKLWHSQVAEGINPLGDTGQIDVVVQAPIVSGENITTIKDKWVTACLSFNEFEAEQIISGAFSQYSPETVCFEVLFAGLSEIGQAWYKGKISVQQEHFASALVTRRLNTLIAGAPLPNRSERIIIATPPNEEHILSPLLINFLLRRRGWDVIYLGADVPLANFRNTIESLRPDLVILTAQQLVTAASLLDLAEDLVRLSIPLAFGGLIFNTTPDLRNRIPGNFLGEELENVVSNIEHIIHNPPKSYITPQQNTKPSLDQFRAELPHIESRVHDTFASKTNMETPPSRYLSRDIVAALKLGNIAYLKNEIDWVQEFLTYTHVPASTLRDFLQSYHQAVDEYLGPEGELISIWLKSASNQLSGNLSLE